MTSKRNLQPIEGEGIKQVKTYAPKKKVVKKKAETK